MPHISKRKLSDKMIRGLEKNFISLIRDSGSKTRLQIFNELLTKTERVMLAKRMGAVLLLRKGLSSYKVSELLGISPSTAERFELGIESNRFRHTVRWVWRNTREGAFEAVLQSLVSLAFTRRTQSFNKFVQEL